MNVDWSEHYVKKGDPHAPVYYIIRRAEQTAGLFALYITVAGRIKYALQRGYLPVVDMKNHPNVYLDPSLLGKENSWEYYFSQPLGITLDQAYSGENVLMCSGAEVEDRPTVKIFENTNSDLAEWRTLVKLGLLRVKPELQKEFDELFANLFSPSDRVLGVCLRGTDYIALKPQGHYIPPPLEYAMTQVYIKLKEWNCNKIFLATEDINILKPFKNFFGDICIITNREYLNYDYKTKIPIGFVHLKRDNDFFLLGKDYLTQVVLLSKCNCLITCRTGGPIGAMMMTDHYENVLAFNFGRYGMVTPEEFI